MSNDILSHHRPMVSRSSLLLPFSALALAALAWAGNAVVGRGMRSVYDPIELTFYRWSIACLCLYLLNGKAVRSDFQLARRNVGRVVSGAVCGMAGFHVLQYYALSRLPATEVAVIVGMTPVTIAVLRVLARRKLPPPRIMLGICVGACGVVLVCYQATDMSFHGKQSWVGICVAAAAMMCWSAYSMRPSPSEGMSWVGALFYMSLAATVILLPPYICDIVTSGVHPFELKRFAQILYLGIPASVIAYGLYNYGIGKVGALRAAQFNCLIPAFASVLAMLLLNEPMTKAQFCGLLLVVAALNLVLLAKSSDNGS